MSSKPKLVESSGSSPERIGAVRRQPPIASPVLVRRRSGHATLTASPLCGVASAVVRIRCRFSEAVSFRQFGLLSFLAAIRQRSALDANART